MELKGKIIDFMGDSITEGDGVTDKVNNLYPAIIAREYGLKKANNYGKSGTHLAFQEGHKPNWSMCDRIFDMDRDADIVTVFGGVNDYLHGTAPFGKIGDTTPETFCGAVDFIMRTLTGELFKGKTVVFFTPARDCFRGVPYTSVSTAYAKLPDAKPLIEYVNVIRKTAQKYAIPVLDLYTKLPIDPLSESDRRKWMPDGLHPDDHGQAVLAKTVADFLLSL